MIGGSHSRTITGGKRLHKSNLIRGELVELLVRERREGVQLEKMRIRWRRKCAFGTPRRILIPGFVWRGVFCKKKRRERLTYSLRDDLS